MSRDEDVLRRVLTAAAGQVEVEARALGEIQDRIATRRRWWLPATRRGGIMIATPLVAVTTAVTVLAAGLVSCVPRAEHPAPPVATGSATPTGSATGGSSTGPAPGPPGPAGQVEFLAAVYYLGSTRGGPLLYREFHPLVTAGTPAARVRAAVTEMLDGRTARDPDYASAWPASAAVRDVRVDADAVTIDLDGAAVNGADPVTARQAVQQLIWTVTAVSDRAGVRLLLRGAPVTTLWGSVPVAGVLHRGPAIDVLAPVWLIEPHQGGVSGPRVAVHIAGIAFEGTVQLRVRTTAGVPVLTRVVQLDVGAPAQGSAQLTIDLAPGTYTVEAFIVSVKDGSEQFPDNHTITVR